MKLPNLLVFLAAAALALVLADQGLRFLGYPSTRFVQIAHPKNMKRLAPDCRMSSLALKIDRLGSSTVVSLEWGRRRIGASFTPSASGWSLM
jgi:hypothetical protein